LNKDVSERDICAHLVCNEKTVLEGVSKAMSLYLIVFFSRMENCFHPVWKGYIMTNLRFSLIISTFFLACAVGGCSGDDGKTPSGNNNSAGTAGAGTAGSGTAGTAGAGTAGGSAAGSGAGGNNAGGTGGTAGMMGTSGTAGTAGTSGTAGTAGTAGTGGAGGVDPNVTEYCTEVYCPVVVPLSCPNITAENCVSSCEADVNPFYEKCSSEVAKVWICTLSLKTENYECTTDGDAQLKEPLCNEEIMVLQTCLNR
jgi:hypothetical protein